MRLLFISTLVALFFSVSSSATPPSKATVAGDSITMAFAADCKYNRYFWDLFCLLGGDQPEHSWFEGNSNNVDSVHDKYKVIDASITANKSAAASGSEMRGGSNNFVTQAQAIVAQATVADHVEVLLGGNDICNRECTDPANCNNPVYTNAEWRSSVQAGLDILVQSMPVGSTVYLTGVPRVQDLRAAGLAKQDTSSRIRCENIWSSYDICNIATSGSSLNGETSTQRLAALEVIQQDYNEILTEEAVPYNSNSNSKKSRGIEVFSGYVDASTSSVGTQSFSANDIDGGDCFHPSVSGQNVVSAAVWMTNTDL
jgi:hypothetical protein